MSSSAESARRFLELRAARRRVEIELDAWTYDALVRIAEARAISAEVVLDEMLEDWTPRLEDLARARRRRATGRSTR